MPGRKSRKSFFFFNAFELTLCFLFYHFVRFLPLRLFFSHFSFLSFSFLHFLDISSEIENFLFLFAQADLCVQVSIFALKGPKLDLMISNLKIHRQRFDSNSRGPIQSQTNLVSNLIHISILNESITKA